MGKKTSTTPQYYGGNISVNGANKASSGKNGDSIYSNYNMSNAEKSIYDFAQNQLVQNLKNINVFSNETMKDFKNQLNAYTQQGQDIINNTYTPMLNNLKSDIAARFGNFDNSSFLNKLNSIESNRANAMNALAQDVMAKQNELVNSELANRYNYLNFMNNMQNQINNNILNYLGLANTNSNMGISYGTNNATIQNSATNNYSQLAQVLMNAILGVPSL